MANLMLRNLLYDRFTFATGEKDFTGTDIMPLLYDPITTSPIIYNSSDFDAGYFPSSVTAGYSPIIPQVNSLFGVGIFIIKTASSVVVRMYSTNGKLIAAPTIYLPNSTDARDTVKIFNDPYSYKDKYKFYIALYQLSTTQYRLLAWVYDVEANEWGGSGISLEQEQYWEFVKYYTLIPDTPTSPEFPGDTSTGGGGGGNFDDSSDSIGLDPLPETSLTETDMVTYWSPTLEELKQVADYISSDLGEFFDFSKIGVSPFENIVSLNQMPFTAPTAVDKKQWRIPNSLAATGITMYPLKGQWHSINCGSLEIKEYWGSALDYSPYTRVSIYLPFVGVQTLSVDEVMNSSITPIYYINMCTGEAVCNILVTKDGVTNPLYSFPCTVSSPMPITASDASGIRNALIKTSVMTAAAVAIPAIALGGAGAAAAGTALAVPSTVGVGAAGAGVGVASVGMKQSLASMASVTASLTAASKASSSAREVISTKAEVMRTGNLSGGSGFMSNKIPYLIITRPSQSLPEDYGTFRGYPSNMTMRLGDLAGFTTVSSINLSNIAAYPDEKQAIETALQRGVIF